MNRLPRVVSVGELLLRLSPPAGEQFFQTPQLRTWFGGSEANVAVSLARFGLRSDYVTRVPGNALGEAAVRALRAEGVGIEHVVYGGARLGIYFVEPGAALRPMRVVYDRERSAFSESGAETFDWTEILADADWLHLSGITPALSDGAAAVANAAVKAARARRVRMSLDLNYREALWQGRDPQPLIRPLAEGVDLLIGNEFAVQAMLGKFTDAEHLAAALVVPGWPLRSENRAPRASTGGAQVFMMQNPVSPAAALNIECSW